MLASICCRLGEVDMNSSTSKDSGARRPPFTWRVDSVVATCAEVAEVLERLSSAIREEFAESHTDDKEARHG